MTRFSVVVTLALALAGLAMAEVQSAGPQVVKSPQEMVGPWQLFIDDYLVSSKTNVIRRYHPFQKYKNNPIIVCDQPWEWNTVKVTTVLPEEDGSGFRMYYGCWSGGGKTGKKTGGFACYATSKDGIMWEKPHLGMYEYTDPETGEKTKDNNILPQSTAWIMRVPGEKDPSKRYRGFGGGGAYHAYSSPDGLHWNKDTEEPAISGGDTSHFYWDPNKNLFRCNIKGGGNDKVSGDVGDMSRRCVGFSESTNPLKFPPLRMIMAPDDLDDSWCDPNTVERTHFYACPVLPYETMYVGFLQIYRADDAEGYFHGPLWLELASSRDGTHWTREEKSGTTLRSSISRLTTSRPPLLDVGKFRAFDNGMVIAPPPVLVGDELRLYYSGYNNLHDLLPYQAAIGLATMRKDGFASLDADEVTGEILTKQFVDAGGVLRVNYNARGGKLLVEVLDAEGRVIPGHGRDECEPLTGDAVRQAVAWKTKGELPADSGPVRLRFILEHVRLYSFMAGEKAKVIDEQATPLQALYTFEGDTESWSDVLGADGLQELRNLGTCVLDHKKPDPAFGKRSLIIGSQFRPWNRVEIEGTGNLGRQFTLAAMVKSTNNKHSRLFTAYNGNFPVATSELIFDFDPSGRVLDGLRLICKGVTVNSDGVTFTDKKYHHLAVVYDDGCVTFYLDGKAIGQQWMPGGEPVKLARNLLIGEDANRGSGEQLMGSVDDVLVYGRALAAQDIATLSEKGARAFFKLAE